MRRYPRWQPRPEQLKAICMISSVNPASTTVLVVDDVPENLAVLGELLRSAGYRVRVANSGEAALRFAAQQPYPALILLALHGVSDAERASVVGTFSSFFDASQGIGALVCGAEVAVTGDRGAFTTGAICAVAGLLVLRARSWSRTNTPAPAA